MVNPIGGEKPFPTPAPAPRPQSQPAPPPPPEPEKHAPAEEGQAGLLQDPLLGAAFQMLRQGANCDHTLAPLADRLQAAPEDQLRHAYQAARSALNALLRDSQGDPHLRGAVTELVVLTQGALRHRGIDPDGPPPSQVKFQKP